MKEDCCDDGDAGEKIRAELEFEDLASEFVDEGDAAETQDDEEGNVVGEDFGVDGVAEKQVKEDAKDRDDGDDDHKSAGEELGELGPSSRGEWRCHVGFRITESVIVVFVFADWGHR